MVVLCQSLHRMIAFVFIYIKLFMLDLHCAFVLVTPSCVCIPQQLHETVYVRFTVCLVLVTPSCVCILQQLHETVYVRFTVCFVLVTPSCVCILQQLHEIVYVRLTWVFCVSNFFLCLHSVLIYTKHYMLDLHCLSVSVTPSYNCICPYLYKTVYIRLTWSFCVSHYIL